MGESGSGFLIYGVPFEQIHFQTSDLSNPLWTKIHRITDLRDLTTDRCITNPTRSFGRRMIRAKYAKLECLQILLFCEDHQGTGCPTTFCEIMVGH